ncbi:hypothetical protein [Colwellia piezophila]|uniref:hypothetical protein n=1 Tax=Colwellia piezophila TaxID=211668 RepID=UPI00037942D8|nr:hypothetical protein [Colwellia piezophila]
MQDNILFYLVFLSQLILISYYLPSKVLARMRHVISRYPPSEYPKLYPQDVGCYKKSHRRFQLFNHFWLLIGVLIIAADAWWSHTYGGGVGKAFPVFFGMFQFMPMLWLELSEFGQFKLMRKSNTNTKRTAELSRRRLFDHVSPALVFSVVGLFFATIVLDLYWHDFTWGGDTLVRAVTLSLVNMLYMLIVRFNLHGKKLNPHQSYEDRSRQVETVSRTLAYLSIVISLFFIYTAAGDAYDLKAYEHVIFSAYFQLIALISIGNIIWGQPLESLNFDVYKADASAN